MSNDLATVDDGISAVGFLQDDALFNRVERFAQIMASGRATIPSELRNLGDCMAITLQALQWKMNPISLAQKVFFIQGKIGYEAQAIAAAINASCSISSQFEYEWFGPWEKVIGKFEIKKNDKGQQYRIPGWRLEDEEGCGIRVSATLRGEGSPRVLSLLLAQARTRNSTQWADDPKQQLAYLAQKKWARLFAPHVILGAYTPDELQEPREVFMGDAEVVPPKPSSLPDYSEDQMRQNLGAWQQAIDEGKTSPEAIISKVQTRYTMSPAQQAVIRSIKPRASDPEPEVDPFVADMEAAEQGE